MELDPARCYQALRSRDRRFDGRFFTGVVTTGIYCRPICPAPTPHLKNVRFYPTAAAAQEAGFRPCRRCRPERSAGTPSQPNGSPLVARGLAMIQAGVLDEEGVDGVATRLAVSTRHLRRLFEENLGASPLAIAKARRVHFARRLVDETDLTMAQIAFAAGFKSIRQFNHDLRTTFAMPPSQMRLKRPKRGANHTGITLSLTTRPPFDWESMAQFYAGRVIPGVEHADGAVYRRTIGPSTAIEARRGDEATLLLTVRAQSAENLITVAEHARAVFDLGADPMRIGETLAADALLAPRVALRPGLRVPGAWDGFECAVRAVIGQRISVAAARQIVSRIAERFGKPVEGFEDWGLSRLFPDAATIAGADLAAEGIPVARAESISELARRCADGRLRFDGSLDPNELRERLVSIRGVGPWTATYMAMRAGGDPDAFPAADLGLRRGAGLEEKELAARAESWRPWRAYAAMHLWRGDGE